MTPTKLIKLAAAWLGFFLVAAVVAKFYFIPRRQRQAADQEREQGKQVVNATSSATHYTHRVRFALDGFSGYWSYRSPEMARLLARDGILLETRDDGGDYNARYKGLQDGSVDAAVFTVDALVQTAADYRKKNPDAPADKVLPATILHEIDETKGADALVGYKAKFANIDSLNRPDTRFVLTPSSPSETLSRVVFSYFALDRVDKTRCFVHTKSSQEVYEVARKADPNSPQVYVVWEPDLSKLLQNPNLHVIVDSGRFRGYIVDVMVARRDFLLRDRAVARKLVEGFLRVSYEKRNLLEPAVRADALASGVSLSDQQASRVVKGIWWKNTSENYGHLGVDGDTGLQHIEDVIRQIVDMLARSDAISDDPTGGQPNLLYYPGVLKELKDSDFHPGVSAADPEEIRQEKTLPALTEDQWTSLKKIGTLNIPDLVFPRGSSELTASAKETLDQLVTNLNTWPTYYITVSGSSASDPQLALDRAKAAEDYLASKGIAKTRIRALAGKSLGATRVNFVLGQQPF